MNKVEKMVVRSKLLELKSITPNTDNMSDIIHWLSETKNNKPFGYEELVNLASRLESDFLKLEDLRAECIQLLEALLEN